MLVMSPAMAARIARQSRKAQRRKLKAEREALADALVLILRDAREAGAPSWFTLEGPAVAVIRAQLCLERWPWSAADWAARDVVNEALARVGAKRPSWQEGQPEFTQGGVIRTERTSCAHCGAPLPEGHKLFCSRRCGQNAAHMRYYADRPRKRGWRRDCGGGPMRDAVEVEPDAWCDWCGDPLPETEERTWHQRFCCEACQKAWHNDVQRERRSAERERRSCKQCGAEFIAMPRTRLFCSRACNVAFHNAARLAREREAKMGRAAPGVAPCDPAGAGKTESAE